MALYVAYGDDSGSHEQSPIMILAVVVATYEAWKAFSNEWWNVLMNVGRPLRRTNRDTYFSSSQAEVLKGCFEGFTREEADAKVGALTDLVVQHIEYAFVSGINWEHFTRILQDAVRRPNGRLRNYFKHPYYLLFHDVTSSVINMQIERDLGEVDFAFDKQGKMLPRCIRMFDEFRPRLAPVIRRTAGQIVPGDDKILLPLQAADLVAWQTRSRSWPYTGRDTSSIKKLAASGKVYVTVINRGFLRYFAQWLNWTPATRMMIARFAGYPMRWPVTSQVTGASTKKRTQSRDWIAPPFGKVL